MNRRQFIGTAAAATAAYTAARSTLAQGANDKIVLALMGAHNRGAQLVERFGKLPNVEIAYICDVDERQLENGVKAVAKGGQKTKPQVTGDFRRALDDPNVDGLICAAPNHWHAAATIMACQAGKHVYVEKPCSHTAEEGELMIDAAKKSGTVVQVGMQRRSGALYQQMAEKVRGGAIGKVLLAKSYYHRNRPTLGHASPETPPSYLDFDMWQGPVAEQPYRSNILHYNWHQFWQWGNGELGNNGVHTIDICRWAMGVDFPSRVTAFGRKLRFDDDQETPDTLTVNYECGDANIQWEGISWSDPYLTGSQIGIELRGTEGTVTINDGGMTIYDERRRPVDRLKESRGDTEHLIDFAKCIQEGGVPKANLDEGHKSVMFCHLGNMAFRSGLDLQVDPTTGHLVGDSPAQKYWGCEYRSKWMPKV
jgi:predicted dehydrogenase